MEARAGNSILDFETLFTDFQELWKRPKHFLYENAFSWKPKKLTKSSVRIGEVSEENSCKIFQLKVWNKLPLTHVPFPFFLLVWSRHTANAPSTAETHTGGVCVTLSYWPEGEED